MMSSSESAPSTQNDWLIDGGDMGRLIRSMDWSQTSLGPLQSWPQSLRMAVSLCLDSPFPSAIAWGAQRTHIYNDACRPVYGASHPQSLGQDLKKCWSAIWPTISDALGPTREGKATRLEEQCIFVERSERLEEAFFTLSFSPIRNESGEIGGTFIQLAELTQCMLAQRRSDLLFALDSTMQEAASESIPERTVAAVCDTLSAHERDLPFFLVYLLEDDARQARLVVSGGLPGDSAACPARIEIGVKNDDRAWPLARALRSCHGEYVDDLEKKFEPLACRPYPEPVSGALLLPLMRFGRELPFGVLVAGVSPRLPFDKAYLAFLESLGARLAAMLPAPDGRSERRADTMHNRPGGHAVTAAHTGMTEPEQRILRMVESNIIGVFSGGLSGGINDANDEMLRIVGYTREDLAAGKINWKEMTPPEFREATARAAEELQRTGTCIPYRKEYVRKDGSHVPVIVWSALVEGAPEKGVAFVLDLSERERTQEALRRSEEQWRDVFENNPTMYFIIDASGTVISVNSVGAEQLGYTVDELLGHSLLQVFPESEQQEAHRHVALCLEHPGRTMSWEIRKVRKNGSMLWVRETAKAVVREKNQLIVLIVGEDITERVDAQEKLRRSETFLAEAQKISHTGSWSWNLPSGTLVWSEEHSRIFGVDPQARTSPTFGLFLQLVHPEDRPRIRNILDEAIRNGSGFDCEYRIVLPNGQMKYVQGMGKPIVSESGCINDYIGTTMDITARKQSEDALRQAHNALEMRVQERTSELKESNRRLELEIIERKRAEAVLARRSQELARSNAELQQLAYIASHDLQEPLRMVASYLQLIERRYPDRLDADGREFIGYAVDGARRMQALIDDLLTYSRIGTKAKPMQPIDCMEAVKTATQSLRLAITETGARITYDNLPTVVADATQLTQLFQNLIANAIKFRRNCPPEIEIRADSEEGFWHIAVSDNGIGINTEYFGRIFEMFQRLHGSKTYSGNGIGLTICRRIVERHGGRIWVDSVPGKGSVFTFTLPKQAGDADCGAIPVRADGSHPA
jgi:PAS domain S-box-containing protein